MKLLLGKLIADKILRDIKDKIKKSRIKPALAVILIGNDKASELYVNLKRKAAKKVGISFYLFRFSANAKESAIIEKIKKLNNDKKINGIIVQLPLPVKFNTQRIINAVKPSKDVDGIHPENLKLLFKGKTRFHPVFTRAIMELITTVSEAKLRIGSTAVVIAKSDKFGELIQKVMKISNFKTDYILAKNLKNNLSKIKKADIVISAVGKPKLINGNMIKKGAIIIDGGITRCGKKVLGDVDFESVKNKASYISPVPGGVGPVTVACLLRNAYLASKYQRNK